MLWGAETWIIAILTGYILGSFPSAYVMGRIKGQDIGKLGDRNAGAANVYRSIGRWPGILVAVVDIAKGLIAVLLGRWLYAVLPAGTAVWGDVLSVRELFNSMSAGMVAGVAVILGHIRPLYLRLPAGRGAATAVGVLLATYPVIGVPLAVGGVGVLLTTRKSTIALAAFLIGIPVCMAATLLPRVGDRWSVEYSYPLVVYAFAVPIMVGLSHYISVRRIAQLEPEGGPAVSSLRTSPHHRGPAGTAAEDPALRR